MSLDERLRSGLRTMAEPVQDSERALHAFREKEYPRRARRRVLESVGAVLAAAAIVAGSTAIVHNLSRRPAGYISRPPGMPTCTHDDLRISTAYGARGTVDIEYAYTSVHKPCWVDQRIRLTIRASTGVLGPATTLPVDIDGNGSAIRIRGVVPAYGFDKQPTLGSPVVGATWRWTNWCGTFRDLTFEFAPIKDAFTYQFMLDKAPAGTCTDKAERSQLQPLGSVDELIVSSGFGG